MAKYDGILIKKSLAYQATSTLMLTDTLESMKNDESVVKQKARIIAVSDGKTLLAYDTTEKESYENIIDKLWLDFQFFFPLAGVEKFVLTEEDPADVKAAVKMALLDYYNELLDKGTYFLMDKRIKTYFKTFQFKAKAENIVGLQVAGLAAYPLTRYVLDKDAVNLSYDIIERKLYRQKGKIHGLKIHPKEKT